MNAHSGTPFQHVTCCTTQVLLLALCSVYKDIRSARVSKFRRAGFKTRAAVIVLPDSSLFRRQRKQHQEDGKSVPETVIADMRGVLTSLLTLTSMLTLTSLLMLTSLLFKPLLCQRQWPILRTTAYSDQQLRMILSFCYRLLQSTCCT